MLSSEECRWQWCILSLNYLNQAGSFAGLARQFTLSRILTRDCTPDDERQVRTSVCSILPSRKLILDTRRTLTTYVIINTIFGTTLPAPTPVCLFIVICVWCIVVHKSWIVMTGVVSGRRSRLLAALVYVLVVGGGDLLGLVARQLDAAPHLARDSGLVPALSQKRVYRLDLVPTWNHPMISYEYLERNWWLEICTCTLFLIGVVSCLIMNPD